MLLILSASVNLSPVFRTTDVRTPNTEATTVTQRLNLVDTKLHEVNKSIEGVSIVDHRQTPPVDDTTTQQSNLHRTPEFSNFSTERQETYNRLIRPMNSKVTSDILATEFFEDDENGSLESSDGEYKTSVPCISQQTKEYIQTPCGVQEARRTRRCNINNLFHISQEALHWIQIMVSRMFRFLLKHHNLFNCPVEYTLYLFIICIIYIKYC
jgi:hypothetical protein